MKQYLFSALLLTAALGLYSCSNKQQGNPRIAGRWFYTGAPDSYIEFNGDTCTEHMGEAASDIIYALHWTDSLHYELEVKEASGLAATLFSPGDKLRVEIKELTPDYYRFYITGKGSPQCIFVVRKKDYNGPTGTPC